MTTSKKTKTSKIAKPAQSALSRLGSQLLQPTTLSGLLTIGSTMATGGLASWLDPTTLPLLLTGIGLIFAKDENSVAALLPFLGGQQAQKED